MPGRSLLSPVEISEEIRAAHPSVPLPILRALIRRGFTTHEHIENYLHPNYTRDVHDPFLFRDMRRVVERFAQAMTQDETVMIHGDYDADGVTASAILSTVLTVLGVKHEVFLPHRELDGYGVSESTVSLAIERGIKLLITADCGIASMEPIALACSNGVDVIIADHHERKEELPKAIAIIHPLVDTQYPDKTLTGGGAAFKVLQAIARTDHPVIVEKRNAYAAEQGPGFSWEGFEKWMLDLAAISTVADCTGLIGESRALVYWGLKVIEKMKRPGVRALLERRRGSPIDSRTIGFTIAPRLNAPGRLEHANLALELLLEKDEVRVTQLASRIETLNIRRQELTTSATQEALAVIGLTPGGAVVAYQKQWPLGIVGIVAARLSDRFARPAFVMTNSGEKIVGSARAPKGYNVLHFFESAKEYLERFGGHTQAGGFTMRSVDHIEGFRNAVELLGSAVVTARTEDPGQEHERVDDEVALEEVNEDLVDWVKKCEPFGMGNPAVRFLAPDCVILTVRTLKEKKHLELTVRSPNGVVRRMIGFGLGDRAVMLKPHAQVDVVFEPRMNEYQGNRTVECLLIDVKVV